MRPREEVKRELVQQWLKKAEADLGVAEHLIGQHSPYRDAIGFHAQQAAEKYLKAYLVDREIEFRKTHDLGELLDLVGTADAALAQALEEATVLNPYGVEIRYPSDFPETTAEDAHRAVDLAQKIKKAICLLLPEYD